MQRSTRHRPRPVPVCRRTYHAAIDDGPTAPAPAPGPIRFPTFEGLRALCAFGVLAYHAGTFTGLTWGRTASVTGVGPWVQHLSVGVSVFFVLSGFLLFRPMVVAHLTDAPRAPLRPYLVRRLVRIYPAYWVALFVSTRLLDLNLGDWWGHLRFYALLQIYWGDTVLGGLVQAWSLCTEVSFYLFLPLWALALSRRGGSVEQRIRTHYLALAGLYLVGIVVRALLRAGDHNVGYGTLAANCDLFAIGMALAVAHTAATLQARPFAGLLRTLGDLPAMSWLAALCCYAAVVSLQFPYGFDPPTVVQEVAREVLFGAVALLLVAPGVVGVQDRGWTRKVLGSRPLFALGVVSYGIYLWHLTVIERLHRRRSVLDAASLPVLIVSSAAISVVVAAASWFGLERPLLRSLRRLDEREPRSASSRVAP